MDNIAIMMDKDDVKGMQTALTYGALELANKKDRAIFASRPGQAHVFQEMEANLNKLYDLITQAIIEPKPTCRKCGSGLNTYAPVCAGCGLVQATSLNYSV